MTVIIMVTNKKEWIWTSFFKFTPECFLPSVLSGANNFFTFYLTVSIYIRHASLFGSYSGDLPAMFVFFIVLSLCINNV